MRGVRSAVTEYDLSHSRRRNRGTEDGPGRELGKRCIVDFLQKVHVKGQLERIISKVPRSDENPVSDLRFRVECPGVLHVSGTTGDTC